MNRSSFTRRARSRGMTLLEIMVSIAILGMVAVLIYGAFDSLSRGKKGEGMRAERTRQGRDALARMVRDLSGAYLSFHNPPNQTLQVRRTQFVGESGAFDRLDFTAFAHRRYEKDAKESDQSEIGYFVVKDPDVDGKMDLVRREQSPPDMETKRGGVVNVIAENVASFDLRYLDATTGQWLETWDSLQNLNQPNRLPFEVRITLVLKGPLDTELTYMTKTQLPIQQPLSFGIAR